MKACEGIGLVGNIPGQVSSIVWTSEGVRKPKLCGQLIPERKWGEGARPLRETNREKINFNIQGNRATEIRRKKA